MESSKATPRPWVLGQSARPHTGRSALLARNPDTGVSELVADFGTSPSRTITEAQANAALSLEAVNSYDREKSAMRALENLTPGGSEYVGDIARCVEFIRQRQASQHQHIISLTKRIRASSERDRSMEVLLGMIDTYHKRILKTPIDIDSYPTAADIFAKNSELLLLLEEK